MWMEKRSIFESVNTIKLTSMSYIRKMESLTHKFKHCLLRAPFKLIKLLLDIPPQVPVWFLWSNVHKWILKKLQIKDIVNL